MNLSQGKNCRTRWLLLAISLFTVLALIAACGGGAGDTSDTTGSEAVGEAVAESDDGAIPTMPAPRFAAPTTMIDATKVAESESAATPEPEAEPDLAFGEEAYGKLCAECHGDAGEGVPDMGESIVGLMSDHDEFVDLLHTGGGYGNDHIFGLSTISYDGIESLFAYAQTLGSE